MVPGIHKTRRRIVDYNKKKLWIFSVTHMSKVKALILLAKVSLPITYAILKLKAHHFIRVNYYTIACWPTT